MITRLDPPIPVSTPKGKAMAIAWIDYGIENDLIWMCIQDDTGECWQWENATIRARQNYTLGRTSISQINTNELTKDQEIAILRDQLRDLNAKLAIAGDRFF